VNIYHKTNLGLIYPGVSAPHIGELYTFPVRNLLHFLVLEFVYRRVRETDFTLNTLNGAVRRKKVFF